VNATFRILPVQQNLLLIVLAALSSCHSYYKCSLLSHDTCMMLPITPWCRQWQEANHQSSSILHLAQHSRRGTAREHHCAKLPPCCPDLLPHPAILHNCLLRVPYTSLQRPPVRGWLLCHTYMPTHLCHIICPPTSPIPIRPPTSPIPKCPPTYALTICPPTSAVMRSSGLLQLDTLVLLL
jgi:hypothetical protein